MTLFCLYTPLRNKTFVLFNISSTFFFQLTDSTSPYFELGQVGSFGSTKQTHKGIHMCIFTFLLGFWLQIPAL